MEQIFNMASAYNQAIWLIVGLVIFVIGGAMLAGHFYYRCAAFRVRGVIKGVRVQDKSSQNSERGQSHEMYYPVFKYRAPNGEIVEAESNSGSSSLVNKQPGKNVDLLVLPHKPFEAMEEGNTLLLLGLVITVCAFIPLGIAFQYATSTWTFMMLGAFAVFGASKFVTSIKPRSEWGTVKEWQERKQKEFLDKRAHLRMLTEEEYYKKLKEYDRLCKKWMPIYILIGSVFLCAGAYTGYGTLDMLTKGSRAQGHVVKIESSYSRDGAGKGHTMYYTVAGFNTPDSRYFEFKDKVSASTPLDTNGDALSILYKQNNPNQAMIDRGLWNWAFPVIFFVPGLLVLVVSFKSHAGIRQRARRAL